MKNLYKNIIKHTLKHKVLLVRSIKAIGGNLLKLFLIDKLAFLIPERFRKLFKILCWFGAKFTLISTVLGVIYSILAEIFSWTFNYKTIIDLILGLVLSLETGLFTEAKVVFTYYYIKFFDWWITKVESTDKSRAKSLRERIFKNDSISVGPIDSKEKARMNKEYLDNLKKQVKNDNETWHEKMVREIKELNNKNRININVTPNYHNSWISLETLKYLMYGLLAVGIIYSYYNFFTTVNSYIFDSFMSLYNSLKDFVQNPLTYLSGATGYLWVKGKEILKRYILRRFWPFTRWFGQNSLSRNDREEDSNNTQGENNYPSDTMNELIGPDIPSMEVTEESAPIKPDYNNYKTKEDYERITNEQTDITQRWSEDRLETGNISSGSETQLGARGSLFRSPSPEPINEPGTSQYQQDLELLEEYSNMTEAEYIDSFNEKLAEFIEANKNTNDPRVQTFIKWSKGEATMDDFKILINRFPKSPSELWMQAQYNKFFYEFMEVDSHKEVKSRLTKSLLYK